MSSRTTAVISLAALALGTVLVAIAAFGQFPSVPYWAGFTDSSFGLTISPDADPLFAGDISPGDHVVHGIQVANNGNLELRYAVTSVIVDEAAEAHLSLTIWAAGNESGLNGDCGRAPQGAFLYGPAAPGGASGIAVVGDPAQGRQEGDRTLAPGSSEMLCFMLSMPLSLRRVETSSVQIPTFNFHAEQTENNP